MSFTAYKIGLAEGGGYRRVLITLEIPKDALTNMGRTDIVKKQTAKYRTNKAIVCKITGIYGTVYQTAHSLYKKKLAYKVGELVEEPEFDTNIDAVGTTGIHFFLDKECAELYDASYVKNGMVRSWYDNGQLKSEWECILGFENGICREWHENGQLKSEFKCIDGYPDGISRGWYKNGQLNYERNFKNREQQGVEKVWYENGQRIYQSVLIDRKTDDNCWH